jgi:hypothetical protein
MIFYINIAIYKLTYIITLVPYLILKVKKKIIHPILILYKKKYDLKKYSSAGTSKIIHCNQE